MFSKTKFKTVPETLHFQLVVTWGQREGINHIDDTSFPKAAQTAYSVLEGKRQTLYIGLEQQPSGEMGQEFPFTAWPGLK